MFLVCRRQGRKQDTAAANGMLKQKRSHIQTTIIFVEWTVQNSTSSTAEDGTSVTIRV